MKNNKPPCNNLPEKAAVEEHDATSLETINLLCGDDGDSYAQIFKRQIEKNEFSYEMIQNCLKILGASLSAAKDERSRRQMNIRKFIVFLDDTERNRYSIMTKNNLEKEIASRKIYRTR